MRTRMISAEAADGKIVTFSIRTPFVLFETDGGDGKKRNVLRVQDADFYITDDEWVHIESQVTGESQC